VERTWRRVRCEVFVEDDRVLDYRVIDDGELNMAERSDHPMTPVVLRTPPVLLAVISSFVVVPFLPL
jgi:hypothetical protein